MSITAFTPLSTPKFGAVKLVTKGESYDHRYELELTDADKKSEEAKCLFAKEDGDSSRFNFTVLHGNYSGDFGGRYSSFQFYEPHFSLISQNKEPGESKEGVHSVKRMTALLRLIQKAKETAPQKAFEDVMDGFQSWLKHAKWENTRTKKHADKALKEAQEWSEVANRRFDKTMALETEFKAFTA